MILLVLGALALWLAYQLGRGTAHRHTDQLREHQRTQDLIRALAQAVGVWGTGRLD